MKQKEKRHPIARMRRNIANFGRGKVHMPEKGGPHNRAKENETIRRAIRDTEKEE